VKADDRRSTGARRARVVLACLAIAVLLLPAAFFPPGGDATLYFESGLKILRQGAAHYRDIVDVKPPLIYHVYALWSAIFGATTSSFRIGDYLLQLVTALSLAGVTARFRSRREGAIAGALYAIAYIAQSYNGTAVTESYVGLVAIPAIALQLSRRRTLDQFLVGALCGVLFLLKFSLATPLAVALVAELALFTGSARERLARCATIVAGFLAVASLLLVYLAVFDAWSGFAQMNTFLAGYVRNQSPGAAASIREALTMLPAYFADGFSLAMLGLVVIGIGLGVRGRSSDRGAALLQLATLDALAMTLGVVVEAKYRAFHLSRLLPFAAILAAAGLVWVAERVRAARPLDRYSRVALALVVPLAIAFSPVARYARHSAGAIAWTLQGPAGFDRAYASETLGHRYTDLAAIGRYVRAHRAPGDELFVGSSVAGLFYAFADEIPPTRIYHSAFLIAPYAPPSWRDETRRYLLERQPRFIALHVRDSMPEMTGRGISSADAVRALPGVDSLLRAAYDTALSTEYALLYERRRR
jgi:4-amino-4-deoxy-L-arabinose transferase-like glycosyltransferase